VTVLVSVAGAVLVLAALRDIFQTLFHPSGRGSISRVLMRRVWRVFRRIGEYREQALVLAGPSVILVVISAWVLMLSAGWALIYWPRLPAEFSLDPGLEPTVGGTFLEALYLSVTTLATLGYGDIVPTSWLLRLLAPLQALVGFGLLTASLSWVLSTHSALSRQRVLAHEVSLLRGAGSEGVPSMEPRALEQLLVILTSQIVAVRSDFVQSPITYYFYQEDERTSLAVAAPGLYRLARVAAEHEDSAVRLYAERMEAAVDELAEALNSQFLHLDEAKTEDVLAAYGREHLREVSGDAG
jgi:hypothetical protein